MSDRLTLRETCAKDRAAYLELLTSVDVYRYVGGAAPRDAVARVMPEVPGKYPGIFAIELVDEFIGAIMVERRGAERPGHLRDAGNELEISFTLLPEHWGRGYAQEAVGAVLRWVHAALPDEPVLLCTQTASQGAQGRGAPRLSARRHVR